MPKGRLVALCCLLVVATGLAAPSASERHAATFSIVAHDPDAGEWGIAVASKVLAVGVFVPWAEAGVGAVATQAFVNLAHGPDGLALLALELEPAEVIEQLTGQDEGSAYRQLGLCDARGECAAFTGAETTPWAGHRVGPFYSVQGNLLVGEEVVNAMAETFEAARGVLARRLLAALVAGDEAGGDSRGKQSAAILVVREAGGYQGVTDRLVDLRVDDDPEPVRRLVELYDHWEPSLVLAHYLGSGDERLLGRALDIVDALEDGVLGDEARAHAYNHAAWELAVRKLHPERALELALAAHHLLPEDANIIDTVAEAHYALGDAATALEWSLLSLELDPENAFFLEQQAKFKAALADE